MKTLIMKAVSYVVTTYDVKIMSIILFYGQDKGEDCIWGVCLVLEKSFLKRVFRDLLGRVGNVTTSPVTTSQEACWRIEED